MKPLLATIAFLVFLTAPASAQILKYVDAQGVTHFVQSLDQIPEQYRGKAEVPKNQPPVTAVESNLPEKPAKKLKAGVRIISKWEQDTQMRMVDNIRRWENPGCNEWWELANDAARKQWQLYGNRIDPEASLLRTHPECFE